MKPGIQLSSVTLLLWLASPPLTRSLVLAEEPGLVLAEEPGQSPPDIGPLLRAAAAPAFSGRYRLGLSFGTSCPVKGPVVSIQVEIEETPAGSRIEVDGRPSDKEDAKLARLVLLREGDHVHGAVSVQGNAEVLGIGTLEGQRVWMQLMADGTAATASGGKVLASGRAFGDLQVSWPGDDSRDTLGSCTARDHSWSLEPF